MQEDIGIRKDMVLKNVIKVIAFDADDTLWENQPYFDEVEEKLCQSCPNTAGAVIYGKNFSGRRCAIWMNSVTGRWRSLCR